MADVFLFFLLNETLGSVIHRPDMVALQFLVTLVLV